MPVYLYQAKNNKGQIVSGTVEAEGEAEATRALWENGLKVFSLRIKPHGVVFSFFNKIKVADLAVFARQMATMISAGIRLPDTLSICINQTQNKMMKEALVEVMKDVQGGSSLSMAMSKHPNVFPKVFVFVTKAGEATGRLDTALLSLAERTEKDASFRGKLRGALIYPAFVFVVLLGVGALMMIKVIPQLQQIFLESNVTLPWATRALIAVFSFLQRGWWAVLLGLAGAIALFRFYIKTEKGMLWWNNLLIKFPILGDTNRMVIMARFTQTFALLVRTGIPILDALHVLADVMDNEIYTRALFKVAKEVEQGVPLSVPLSKDKNFPPVVGQMIGVGEKSGSLDQILERLGNFFENQVEDRTKVIGSLVEPIVIVILGIGVAILIFAILMPIYQLAQIE